MLSKNDCSWIRQCWALQPHVEDRYPYTIEKTRVSL